MQDDKNIYKRITEYCLDISDICDDQMVHELTLSLPVAKRDPQPSALYNTLRNCNISGLFRDSTNKSSFLAAADFEGFGNAIGKE